MNYTAHYLRFASQAEADQVLEGADLAARDDVGELLDPWRWTPNDLAHLASPTPCKDPLLILGG